MRSTRAGGEDPGAVRDALAATARTSPPPPGVISFNALGEIMQGHVEIQIVKDGVLPPPFARIHDPELLAPPSE